MKVEDPSWWRVPPCSRHSGTLLTYQGRQLPVNKVQTTCVSHATGEVIAEGSFSDASLHKSNFGQLRVSTLPGAADRVQMRAAGHLEGFLTAGLATRLPCL